MVALSTSRLRMSPTRERDSDPLGSNPKRRFGAIEFFGGVGPGDRVPLGLVGAEVSEPGGSGTTGRRTRRASRVGLTTV